MMNQRAAFKETVQKITDTINWSDDLLSNREKYWLEHIQGMEARMDENFSDAKIGRWLGWVQGVSNAYGWLTLDDVKAINKKYAG
jgi:hypothetical protein